MPLADDYVQEGTAAAFSDSEGEREEKGEGEGEREGKGERDGSGSESSDIVKEDSSHTDSSGSLETRLVCVYLMYVCPHVCTACCPHGSTCCGWSV